MNVSQFGGELVDIEKEQPGQAQHVVKEQPAKEQPGQAQHVHSTHWRLAMTAVWQTGLMNQATLEQNRMILAYAKSNVLLPYGW